ncbi:hypothetical protein [Pseudoxanthomonas sp. PXM02]|uniref:hypothetical protein n=1 Tax=Pseudoxanthomonas sp. PXM02 TaxID=2769294 RepID=UPI00177F67A1|nr:hypothetical protein [Pseudoxanthomonas sp. PXM02]MBD9479862.1 hypothetical protein [Pseudoxanthomonas sp. PXM02]
MKTKVTKPKKPKKQGRPRRKSAQEIKAAVKRAGELSAILWMPDSPERQLADAMFQRTYINKDLLAKEPSVQQTVWPEYGYMTPLERTHRFGQEYIAAYRRQWALTDPHQARKAKPLYPNLGGNDIGDMNCLWKARQAADERGIPYDLFLDALMARKVGTKQELHLPRPNQLLSDKLMEPRLRCLPNHQQVSERLLGPSWDRRFFHPRDQDDPVQAAAMKLLRIDVLMAPSPKDRLAKYLGQRGLLSTWSAHSVFADNGDLVDEALKLVKAPIEPTDDVVEYRPKCFGNRNPELPDICGKCPVTNECKAYKIKVAHALRKKTGTSDPRLERRRQLDRERQRKRREGLRNGAVTHPLKA